MDDWLGAAGRWGDDCVSAGWNFYFCHWIRLRGNGCGGCRMRGEAALPRRCFHRCELTSRLDDCWRIHRVPWEAWRGGAGVVHFSAARYVELYRVAGQARFLARLLVGMGLTCFFPI